MQGETIMNNLVIGNTKNSAIEKRADQQNNMDRYFSDIFKRLPANTQRAFTSTLNSYSTYCMSNDLIGFSPSMNENIECIKSYVTSMCESQLAYSTVNHRVSILSKMFSIASLPNPIKESDYLRDFIKLELQEFDIYSRAKQAPALRLSDLETINSTVIPDNLLDIRDLALVNIMFDGLLRADEVARIQIKHLNFEANKLLVEKSKSDQSGKGSYRYASATSLDYIADYLQEANAEKDENDPTRINEGILFRAISPKGTSIKPYDESIKRVSKMKVLNYSTIFRAIKRIAKKAGIELEVSGHSLRVGGAVSMAEANQSVSDIKKAGGWSSESMPARYTEQANVSMGMSELAKKFNR